MQGREVEVRVDANSVKQERKKKLKSEGQCKLSRPSVSPHRTQICKKCVVTLSCYSFGRGSADRPFMRYHHHQRYRWTPRRCTSRYGRYPWPHRCRRHCTWLRITRRIWKIFKNSEFENIESLFNAMNMMIAGNSELKNLFPTDSANPSWERSTLPNDQAIEWTKARVYVYSDSSAMHVKNARSRSCSQQMERTRVNLTDVPSFQRITMESRLHSRGRFSQEPQLWNISKKFKKTMKENASDLKVSVIEQSS